MTEFQKRHRRMPGLTATETRWRANLQGTNFQRYFDAR